MQDLAGDRRHHRMRGRVGLLGLLVLVGLTLVAMIGFVVVWLVWPSVIAIRCPGCFGFERIGAGVYAEPTSGQRQQQIREVVRVADDRVQAFYGGRASTPDVLVCVSARCYERVGGGGSRGVAVLNRAVMLSPRGIAAVILSHELAHVELHDQLGNQATRVPQWFDEGLAVLISEDPRYLAPATSPDRCLVAPTDRALPSDLDGWLREASDNEQTYAMAACQVSRWVGPRDGPTVVLALISRLRSGEPFEQAIH